LEKCGNRFASQGVKSVESKVLLAHPSKSVKGLLCEHADNLKPDVIVCGSRGKGYMGRLFLGSVSDYLMHNAKCTVMVIKDEGVPKPGAKEKKMDEGVPKPGAKEKKMDEGVPKPGAKEKKMDEGVPKPGAKEKKIG